MTKAKADLELVYPDGRKTSLRLGRKPLNRGADGEIYAAPGGKLALKIYHEPTKDPERPEKIRQMLLVPPDDPGMEHFAWPIAQLNNRSGQFVGYAMRLLPVAEFTSLDLLLTRKGRQIAHLPESREFRVKAAENLARRVAQLHSQGHCIIDLKPANLLVHCKTADIVVVDCDGFAIQGEREFIPGHQFTTGYIAPEAWQQRAKPESLGKEQDLFALAVIIFQLVNEGLHPYQGIPASGTSIPSDTQSRIGEELYAYGRAPNPKLRPSPWSLHKDFPSPLEQSFENAFRSRQGRPNAAFWVSQMGQLIPRLVTCKKDRRHRFWGQSCPLCEQTSVTVKVKKPKPRRKRRARTIPRPHRHIHVQQNQHNQTSAGSTAPFSIIGGLFFTFLIFGYGIHLFNESTAKKESHYAEQQRQADQERREQQKQQQEQLARTQRPPWQQYGSAADINLVHVSRHPVPDRRGARIAFDRKDGDGETVPDLHLGHFESYKDLDVLLYSPAHGLLRFAEKKSLRMTRLNLLSGAFEETASYPADKQFSPKDWHLHPESHALYLRDVGYQANSYSLIRLSRDGEISEFVAHKGFVNDGSGRRISVDPWHFAVTDDEQYVIIAGDRSLRVHTVSSPDTPPTEIDYPQPYRDFAASDLAITSDGKAIFVGLSRKNRNYGIDYKATVLEYTLADGKPELTTDFLTDWPDDSSVPAPSVDVSADGNTLAIGEYRELKKNSSRYTVLGDPVTVRTGFPGVQILQRLGEEQQWQRTGRQSLNRRGLLYVPDNPAMGNFGLIRSANGVQRFSIDFEMTPDGQRLRSGLELEKRSRTETIARAWLFNISDGELKVSDRLEASYATTHTYPQPKAVPVARLSNDGTKAVMGWASYLAAIPSTQPGEVSLSLSFFSTGKEVSPGSAQVEEH